MITIANAGAGRNLYPMNTAFASTPTAAAVLAESDPRSQANIERRQALRIAERDSGGKLLPGSVLERAGRPPGATITTLARLHTTQALAVLREIVDDAKAPPAARATAAQALLDRGWGKAPIQIDVNVRQKFDDFLREVGLAAREEQELIEAEAADPDE